MGNLVGRTAKMGTSLIDRTNPFLFGGGRRNARPWIGRLELTAYEPRASGKPNFQDNAESIFEDDYSIGSKASGRVFGEGLPSNVRSCVRRNSRPARVAGSQYHRMPRKKRCTLSQHGAHASRHVGRTRYSAWSLLIPSNRARRLQPYHMRVPAT